MISNKSDSKTSKLIDSIRPLAKQLMELRAQMEALGMFTNDRELLECPTCDLAEGVAADGRLMTYHRSDIEWATDSGLRFKAVDKDFLRCPVCGTTQRVEVL